MIYSQALSAPFEPTHKKKPPAEPGAFRFIKLGTLYQPPNFSMYPPMKTTRMMTGRMYLT